MAKDDLKYSIKREKGLCVVAISGYFDYNAWENHKDKLTALVSDTDTVIVADLSGITYLSSRGLGYLLSLNDRVKKNGGEVRIAGLKESIASLFEKGGFLQIFKLYATLDEAVGNK